jgi:hypothetical protein
MGFYSYGDSELSFYGTWNNGELSGPIHIIHPIYRYKGYWSGDRIVGPGIFEIETGYSLVGTVQGYNLYQHHFLPAQFISHESSQFSHFSIPYQQDDSSSYQSFECYDSSLSDVNQFVAQNNIEIIPVSAYFLLMKCLIKIFFI